MPLGKWAKKTGLVVDDPTCHAQTLERIPVLAEPTKQFDASLLAHAGVPLQEGGCRQGSRAHWDTSRTEHGFIVHVPSCTSQPFYSDSELPKEAVAKIKIRAFRPAVEDKFTWRAAFQRGAEAGAGTDVELRLASLKHKNRRSAK